MVLGLGLKSLAFHDPVPRGGLVDKVCPQGTQNNTESHINGDRNHVHILKGVMLER